jgi:hypothetical protein
MVMLREGMEETLTDVEPVLTWARGNPQEDAADWRTVDRALRAIRTRRAALDAEEARWLREAEALEIWRPLGMVSALDYLERVLGYAPRTAQERLRVARALGALPKLTSALADGELPYSAIRELTRVATPATEASWIAASSGRNLRQIEELVADHRPGDRPDDPPDPEAHTHVVRFELSAETFALLRQTRTVLDDEHGKHLARSSPRCAARCSTVHPRPSPPAARSSRSPSPCASAVARAGKRALARRSRSALQRSIERCAMPSTSDRSTALCQSGHTRTSRQASRASSGAAMEVGAAWTAAGHREGWNCIT